MLPALLCVSDFKLEDGVAIYGSCHPEPVWLNFLV